MSAIGKVILCFFFNDTATTEIYTLSLHDALPISTPELRCSRCHTELERFWGYCPSCGRRLEWKDTQRETNAECAYCGRSEEHTSELQSQSNLVCRLLLEKKTPYC